MNKTKRGWFKTLFMSLACVFAIGLSSCGEGGGGEPAKKNYEITWVVDEHATVNVKDHDEKPATLPEGATLSFTVDVASGYELGNVIANNKRVSLYEGYYNVRIARNTKITITTNQKATGIEITSNPANLTYFAGDALDVTGMVVKVKFADNTTQELAKGPKGYAVSPSVFEGGETSFKVIYGKFTAEVQLAQRVEFKVTIDPAGGTISETWINSVKGIGVNNFAVSDTGIVTFTYYNNIARPISMPTAEQITRDNYSFISWSNEVKTITNATAANYETTASWQAELLKIDKVDLLLEETTPYLIVEGTFKLADKVTLLLYEGNVQAGFKGTTITNEAGPGSAFKLKYNLLELTTTPTGNESDPTFEGKWMDIKFVATIDGEEKTQDINIGPESAVEADMSKKINTGVYTFSFHEYDNWIKVDYTTNHYVYQIDFSTEAGVDYLNIRGTAAPKYYGKNFGVSWEFNGEGDIISSKIGVDGKFLIKVDLTDIEMNKQGFAHAYIYDTDPSTNLLSKDGNRVNLMIAQCQTPLPDVKVPVETNINKAVKYKNEHDIAYYAGHGWDGLMLIKVEEAFTVNYTTSGMELVDGEIFYVIQGSYSGVAGNELAFSYNAQVHSAWDYPVETTRVTKIIANEEASTFKAYIPTTAMAERHTTGGGDSTVFIIHFGIKDAVGDVKNISKENTVINKNGLRYSVINNNDTWSMNCVKIENTTNPDGVSELRLNTANVAIVNERVIFTLSGTISGLQDDYFSTLLAVRNGEYNGKFGYNFSNAWEELPLVINVKVEGNNITITSDITDLDICGYTMNYKSTENGVESGKTDLFLTSSLPAQEVVLGNKLYRVSEDLNDKGNGLKCWGVLMLEVLAAPIA